MAFACRLSVLVILLALVFPLNLVSSAKDDFSHCETTVRNWAESSSSYSGVREDKLTLKDLLFFLHIPRTGGRAYFHCFLRKLYTSDQECPRSYDKLRFDPSKTKCRLMVTHDDYSLMSKLPKERTSVVTILRNPIDRVFSTYEFSAEVAARFLVHPNLTSATQMSIRIRPKSRGVSTLDIWPWKYLVPWMREDLFARRDARKLRASTKIKETSNPYDMQEIVMPLHAFIDDPIAHDIIHNGATFQIAGLTNNSCLLESHEVRHCVRRHPALGQYVLEVAKKRLDNMLYVGLTEDHRKSATMFGNMVGAQVLSQSESSTFFGRKATDKSEVNTSFSDSMSDSSNLLESSTNSDAATDVPSPKDIQAASGNMTVGKLMEAYEVCVSSLRKSQSSRRTMSLKRIAPANFSKEARSRVPKGILQKILMLNSLDVELYEHAQHIFDQQHIHLEEILASEHDQIMSNSGIDRIIPDVLYRFPTWKISLVAVATVLLSVLLYLIVTARRNPSKLKV